MERLTSLFPSIEVCTTYGYITKYWRERKGIEKTHVSDAFVITKNLDAKRLNKEFIIIPKRQHNRQIHKCKINKGGTRKKNQTPKYVFGYQLFDKVLYQEKEVYIFGRRMSGSFDIRKLDGTKISSGVSYKKLRHIEYRKPLLISYL